jgi:hypothetical protein
MDRDFILFPITLRAAHLRPIAAFAEFLEKRNDDEVVTTPATIIKHDVILAAIDHLLQWVRQLDFMLLLYPVSGTTNLFNLSDSRGRMMDIFIPSDRGISVPGSYVIRPKDTAEAALIIPAKGQLAIGLLGASDITFKTTNPHSSIFARFKIMHPDWKADKTGKTRDHIHNFWYFEGKVIE